MASNSEDRDTLENRKKKFGIENKSDLEERKKKFGNHIALDDLIVKDKNNRKQKKIKKEGKFGKK